MSFAAFMPRQHWLNVLHAFRLASPAEVDAQFSRWLAEAYQVGAQQHLRRPAQPPHQAQL